GVDDCASALLEHLRNLCLHTEPHTGQIDCEHAIPFLFAAFVREDALAADASVVERTVEPPIGFHRLGDQRVHLLRFRHVGPEEQRVSPEFLDHLQCLLAARFHDVRQNQAGACGGKNLGGSGADPGSSASNKSVFAVQYPRHDSVLLSFASGTQAVTTVTKQGAYALSRCLYGRTNMGLRLRQHQAPIRIPTNSPSRRDHDRRVRLLNNEWSVLHAGDIGPTANRSRQETVSRAEERFSRLTLGYGVERRCNLSCQLRELHIPNRGQRPQPEADEFDGIVRIIPKRLFMSLAEPPCQFYQQVL